MADGVLAVLEFDSFASKLLGRLRVPSTGLDLTPSTGLFDELALDSIQAFELILVVEDLAGMLLPEAEIPPVFTLGDAFNYYRTCCDTTR